MKGKLQRDVRTRYPSCSCCRRWVAVCFASFVISCHCWVAVYFASFVISCHCWGAVSLTCQLPLSAVVTVGLRAVLPAPSVSFLVTLGQQSVWMSTLSISSCHAWLAVCLNVDSICQLLSCLASSLSECRLCLSSFVMPSQQSVWMSTLSVSSCHGRDTVCFASSVL